MPIGPSPPSPPRWASWASPTTIAATPPRVGNSGHPDHVAVGRATTLAWRRRRTGRLLYATKTTTYLERYGTLHAELGIVVGDRMPGDDDDVAIEVTLSDAELDRKRLSLGAHHSQTAPLIELMGEPLYREWNRVETFRNATADDFTEAVDHLTHLIPT